MTARFGIDVGNSTTKWIRLPADGPPADSAELSSWVAGCEARRGSFEEVLAQVTTASLADIVSVAPRRSQELVDSLVKKGVAVTTWTSATLPIKNTYADDTTLGPDRPLAAYAARAEFGCPVIVVDAGTALTVDLVGEDGTFLGGSIAPGLQTIARALGDAGAMLHEARPQDLAFPATSTADCLALGSYAAFAGALRELVGKAKERFAAAPVVVTGGDAAEVMTILEDVAPIERPLITIALSLLSWRSETAHD